MYPDSSSDVFRQAFDGRAVVTISIDTEQIWGYMDFCDEARFSQRYPNAIRACDGLLQALCDHNVSATWAVVGGLTLAGSSGQADIRFQNLPAHWTSRIVAGDEMSHPYWYRRKFFRDIKSVKPQQDVGLHGGLTHLIWDDPRVTPEDIERELVAGISALNDLDFRVRSFVFPRNRERLHDLLLKNRIICYRGQSPASWERMGNIPRALWRILLEMGCSVPPVIWPSQPRPGLWNIPASLALYPMRRLRSTILPLSTRVKRFSLGVQASVAAGGIFHFCLHPDNLAESPRGPEVFRRMLEELENWRRSDGVLVLSMADIAERMSAAMRTSPHRAVASRT